MSNLAAEHTGRGCWSLLAGRGEGDWDGPVKYPILPLGALGRAAVIMS
jgi:hypothetical protein